MENQLINLELSTEANLKNMFDYVSLHCQQFGEKLVTGSQK